MTITAARLLKMSSACWETCTLQAAVKLDLFTVIGRQTLSAEAVGQAIGGSERGVPLLLNALTAMGLLKKENNAYANTNEGFSLLSRESAGYIGHIIMHHHHLMDSWNHLAEAVVTGRPQRARASGKDGEERESFLMGMFNLAMGLGPRVAEAVDLSGCHRLLDLGGGPGTYAIHFCLKYPRLEATVFDLPATRPFAEKTIDRFGLQERIRFIGGDFVRGHIEGRYDAVWLSQILHGEGRESCEQVIRKAVSVLDPGGLVLIHEFLLRDSLDGPLFPAIFSLNMLVGTKEGRSYSGGQIREMLKKAGIVNIKRLPLRMVNGSRILAGVVPTGE
jgi:hypothetical protein